MKYGYARGDEPVKYVDAIQNYYDIIQNNEAKMELERVEAEKIAAEKAAEKARLREENKGKVGLVLLTKTRKWIGYIDMQTKKKYQTFASSDFEIDANKDWLLLFGGGSVQLDVNHELQTFSSENNLRFKYEDGKLTKIGIEEFMSLNNGNKW